MTWRKTLAYWAAAAVLFGYIFVFERQEEPPPGPDVKREKVLPFFGDEIVAFSLERAGRTVSFEREDKRWKVVEPKGGTVPPDLVAALVETLAEKQEAEVITDSPSGDDLRGFGLDEPRAVYRLVGKDGKEAKIQVGRRNPTRTAIYAKPADSNRVLLVGLNVEYYGDLVFEAAFPGRPKA